mmetsp:Transcript_74310/g.135775  ORF Transcript_74310/g.135775 Transcript_74310/m.135775 type:complete len:325 (+) Transcript_74310:1173-2147(+)
MIQRLPSRYTICRVRLQEMSNESPSLCSRVAKPPEVHTALQILDEHILHGFSTKRTVTHQENVHQHTYAETINKTPILLATQNLRCHISWRATSHLHGLSVPIDSCQAKIHKLDLVILANKNDILSLDVPMHYTSLMQEIDCGKELPNNISCSTLGQRAIVVNSLKELATTNKLSDNSPCLMLGCGIFCSVSSPELQHRGICAHPAQDRCLSQQWHVLLAILLVGDLHCNQIPSSPVVCEEDLGTGTHSDKLIQDIPVRQIFHEAARELQLCEQLLQILFAAALKQPCANHIFGNSLTNMLNLHVPELLGQQRLRYSQTVNLLS